MEQKTALVIDDDPDIRRMIRSYLEKLAFVVKEAGTGKAAMEILHRERLSLVVLDLILPEISGYDICERIRSRPQTKDVPVLVISAKAAPADRATAEELGASAYLVKPLRRRTFVAAVEMLVRGEARDAARAKSVNISYTPATNE